MEKTSDGKSARLNLLRLGDDSFYEKISDEADRLDLEREFEARFKTDNNPYEVSEMSEADDVSMFSYRTMNNDKYFIPEGADLDEIADQLLNNKKSKLVQKLE